MSHTHNVVSVVSVVLAALLGFSGIATAQYESDADGYIGIRYANLDTTFDSNMGSADASTPVMMLNAGFQIDSYFAVEGRLGIGIGDDDGVEIDSYYGIFARVGAPPTQKFAPYLLVGYGNGELEIGTLSVDDNDFAYGIGANINVNADFAINVEYMNYYDEPLIDGSVDLSIEGFSIGFEHRF